MKLPEELSSKLDSLREENSELQKRHKEIKNEALNFIKELVIEFDLSYEEVLPIIPRRSDTGKKRKIKYRTPNGIEWSGLGTIKKDLKKYLDQHNLSEADIEKFRVED